ncbi:MAG: UDP-N-acetylmuramoyl-tripeptide--D-alanyl-D-alanine ligase [Patescibacteria group bacterium]|nr:UDP-N-acetylmuramoyl-tripeptide--D-alanyl-D-alanine ligase [Patescibacteria group bacterium]
MLKAFSQFVLKCLARAVLWRHRPKVVGITGSVGKTTTKEAIYTVLSSKYHTAKSEGNFNNEIGLPLSVLGVGKALSGLALWLLVPFYFFRAIFNRDYPAILVLEMGADHPGDINYLAKIARPEVGVVTRVAEAHTEFFGDIETVQREKFRLITSLSPQGLAVLNVDDPRVVAMRHLYSGEVVTFGLSEEADVRASNIKLTERLFGPDFSAEKDIGTSFTLRYGQTNQNIEVAGILGMPLVYSLLAAAAVGEHFDLSPREISSAIKQISPTPGRLRPLSGIKSTILLDDSYNSSPEAVIEAFKVLKQIRSRRRIAVLGDMLELGVQTETAHRRVGRIARDVGVGLLFTVGERAKFIADEARASGFPKTKIFEFATADEAGLVLQKKLEEGDVVLIKGSQGMRMERIVLEVMANPEDAAKLLCRQSKKWQKTF